MAIDRSVLKVDTRRAVLAYDDLELIIPDHRIAITQQSRGDRIAITQQSRGGHDLELILPSVDHGSNLRWGRGGRGGRGRAGWAGWTGRGGVGNKTPSPTPNAPPRLRGQLGSKRTLRGELRYTGR